MRSMTRMKAVNTVDDVAAELTLTPVEVERLVASGELKAARIGARLLFSDADLDAFLKARGSHGLARRAPPRGVWAMASALVLLFATGLWAAFPNAANLEGLPVVLPYAGTVHFNGAPLNGEATMRFDFYNDVSAGAQLWSSGDVVVVVSAGRFSVVLGTPTPIPSRLFLDNEDVYLAITVNGVALPDRQNITPTPYALRAAYASAADDFVVAGEMAANTAVVTGELVAGSAAVSGQVQAGSAAVSGQVQAGSASVTNALSAGSGSFSGGINAGSSTIGGVSLSSDTVSAASASFSQGNLAGNRNSGGARIPGSPLYFRWGRDISTSDNDETFVFNAAFPNECLGVIVNRNIANAANPFEARSCSNSSFIINRADSTDGSEPFSYIAIGH